MDDLSLDVLCFLSIHFNTFTGSFGHSRHTDGRDAKAGWETNARLRTLLWNGAAASLALQAFVSPNIRKVPCCTWFLGVKTDGWMSHVSGPDGRRGGSTIVCIRTHGSTDLQRDSAKLRCVHDGWRLFFGADAVRNLRGFSAVCRQRPRTVIRCPIFDGSFRSEAGIACFAMYRGRGTCAVEVDAFWTCGSSPRPCELRVQLLCAQAKERCNALWFWVHGQCFPPRKARLGELSKVDGNLPPSRHPDPFAEVRFVSHASSICRARDRTFFFSIFFGAGCGCWKSSTM